MQLTIDEPNAYTIHKLYIARSDVLMFILGIVVHKYDVQEDLFSKRQGVGMITRPVPSLSYGN